MLSYLGSHGQGQDAAGLRPGSTVTLEPPDPQAVVQVRPPAGKPVVLGRATSGRCNFTATNELGIYEAQANGKTFQRFAVNLFDPLESDIRPAKEPAIKIGHVTVAGQTGWEAANREIWKELLLLARQYRSWSGISTLDASIIKLLLRRMEQQVVGWVGAASPTIGFLRALVGLAALDPPYFAPWGVPAEQCPLQRGVLKRMSRCR